MKEKYFKNQKEEKDQTVVDGEFKEAENAENDISSNGEGESQEEEKKYNFWTKPHTVTFSWAGVGKKVAYGACVVGTAALGIFVYSLVGALKASGGESTCDAYDYDSSEYEEAASPVQEEVVDEPVETEVESSSED